MFEFCGDGDTERKKRAEHTAQNSRNYDDKQYTSSTRTHTFACTHTDDGYTVKTVYNEIQIIQIRFFSLFDLV